MAEKSTGKPASEKQPREPEEEREDASEEEEDESSEDESDEDEGDDKASSKAKSAAKPDEDDDGDDEPESDDASAKKGARDETTRGVAKALGVDSDEEEEEAEDGEDGDEKKSDAKPNRAQRRRDEAEKRRAARDGKPAPKAAIVKTKAAADATDTAEPEEEAPKQLPRDKNARAKELLRRRQESAMGKRVSKLEASEVVQDRIVRATSAVGRFLRDNFKAVAAVLVLGLGGAIGVSVYLSHRASVIAKRSDELNKGVISMRGYVAPKGDPGFDAKLSPFPMFTSLETRADAAIAGFVKVSTESKGTAAATLARLGEGTAQLDKRAWDAAFAAFNEVVTSPLANADADVKGRALEGAGYAKEGLEKFDEAIELFKQLETTKGMEDLGKYHRARMLLKQGNVEEAKTALVELQKKLEVPLPDAPKNRQLAAHVDSALRVIDPTLVKKPAPGLGGMRGNSMTAEQMRQLQESLKLLEKDGHGDEGPTP